MQQQAEMEGKTFAKLAKDCKLLSKTVTTTDIDLIFTKVRGGRVARRAGAGVQADSAARPLPLLCAPAAASTRSSASASEQGGWGRQTAHPSSARGTSRVRSQPACSCPAQLVRRVARSLQPC